MVDHGEEQKILTYRRCGAAILHRIGHGGKAKAALITNDNTMIDT